MTTETSNKARIVTMVQMVLPSDTNALQAAFGGSVMGWIDIAAAVAAQRHCRQTVVTASMDDLHFHAPIKVGWTANIAARVIATFNTSMEIGVTVHSENPLTGERRLTTSALLTFVALDKDGKKLPVPPLQVDTDAERKAVEEAKTRRHERLSRKDLGNSWMELFA
jgi:acyl-CoA hydrolase